jgi:flavin reductase (DIM6/NTAB) family NADH-FMN oxidoreductase RutF
MQSAPDTVATQFLDAMRRLAATVTIVTVRSGEQRHGTTATAVTSLSMDPPSLLVCLNRSSRLHEYLSQEERFSVNILHVDNERVSSAFARPLTSEERFAQGDWRDDGELGVHLADAQATLFCIKDKVVDYGSHTIFIGRVVAVKNRADIAPLLYCNGRYETRTTLPVSGST